MENIISMGIATHPDEKKALKELLFYKNENYDILAVETVNFYEYGKKHNLELTKKFGLDAWSMIVDLHKKAGAPLPDSEWLKEYAFAD